MWREAPLLFSSKREYIYICNLFNLFPPRNGFVLDLFYFGGPSVGYVMTRESFDPSGPGRLRAIPCCRAQSMWSICTSLSKAAAKFNSALHTGYHRGVHPVHLCSAVRKDQAKKRESIQENFSPFSIGTASNRMVDLSNFQMTHEDSKMGWFVGWRRRCFFLTLQTIFRLTIWAIYG